MTALTAGVHDIAPEIYPFGWEPHMSRFLAKISLDPSGCWLWTASLDGRGYPQFNLRGANVRGHRLSYLWAHGALDDSLTIDHLCRKPTCVNPAHLEQVTIGVNVLRGDTLAARNKVKTHCPQGHAYTPTNIIWRLRSTGTYSRNCRTCVRAASRRAWREAAGRVA